MILAVCANPAIDSLAMIPSLSPGEMHRIQREDRFPGGKGVHIALGAVELKEKSTLLGFWAGPTGDWIQEQCRNRGIACDGVQVPGFNRICYTFQSPGEYNETELLGCGPTVSAQELELFAERYLAAAKKSKIVVISGSMPSGAPVDFYAKLVRSSHTLAQPVVLDATGEGFALALKEKPKAIHLNLKEATALTGKSQPLEILAGISSEIETVAITAGVEGLYLRHKGERIHANVAIIKTASAVGSGDCLTAGLALGLMRDYSTQELARLAVACGAANCLFPALGMFLERDVEMLLPKVQWQRLGAA